MEHLKNRTAFAVILIAFFSGVLLVFTLPGESSLRMQQFLFSEPVNAPQLEAFATSNLINIQAVPANNIVLAQSYYFIAFTSLNQDNHIKTIEIQFPSGFVLSNATVLEQVVPAVPTFSISGQKLIFTFPTEQSAGNYPFSFLIAGVENGKSLKNQISITTKDQLGHIILGPSLSPVFTLTKITNSMIGSNAVTNAKIAPNSVNGTQIVNGAITKAKFANGTLTYVIRFSGGPSPSNSNPLFFNYGTNFDNAITGATFSGVNGTITKFYYNVFSLPSGTTVKATLYVNGNPTSISCTVVGGPSPIACQSLTKLSVSSSDLIAVGDQVLTGGVPTGDNRNAYIVINETLS